MCRVGQSCVRSSAPSLVESGSRSCLCILHIAHDVSPLLRACIEGCKIDLLEELAGEAFVKEKRCQVSFHTEQGSRTFRKAGERERKGRTGKHVAPARRGSAASGTSSAAHEARHLALHHQLHERARSRVEHVLLVSTVGRLAARLAEQLLGLRNGHADLQSRRLCRRQ